MPSWKYGRMPLPEYFTGRSHVSMLKRMINLHRQERQHISWVAYTYMCLPLDIVNIHWNMFYPPNLSMFICMCLSPCYFQHLPVHVSIPLLPAIPASANLPAAVNIYLSSAYYFVTVKIYQCCTSYLLLPVLVPLLLFLLVPLLLSYAHYFATVMC